MERETIFKLDPKKCLKKVKEISKSDMTIDEKSKKLFMATNNLHKEINSYKPASRDLIKTFRKVLRLTQKKYRKLKKEHKKTLTLRKDGINFEISELRRMMENIKAQYTRFGKLRTR